MKLVPTKTQLVTIAFALVALALINKVGALAPVKKLIN
jgi:hypothetical protein